MPHDDAPPARARFSRVPVGAARANLSSRQFRVLIAISAFADRGGRAWPGVTAIAELVGCERSKIPGEVRRLEEAGLLRVERQAGRGNSYLIIYDAEPLPKQATAGVAHSGNSSCGLDRQQSTEEGVAHSGNSSCGLDRQQSTEEGVAHSGNGLWPKQATELWPIQATKQILEQPNEQNHTPSLPLGGEVVDRLPDRFDEVWAAWPRREAKKSAVTAFRAATRKVTPDLILAGAERFLAAERALGRPVDKYPHLATWLRGERWADEPLSVNGAKAGRTPGGAMMGAVLNVIAAADGDDQEHFR